jgi:hypothetical protein
MEDERRRKKERDDHIWFVEERREKGGEVSYCVGLFHSHVDTRMICGRKKRKRGRGLILCWFISFPCRYKDVDDKKFPNLSSPPKNENSKAIAVRWLTSHFSVLLSDT